MAEPWLAPLQTGDPEGAWDRFIERYRRLIFGAIRRSVTEPDDVMDIFAHVCEALREKDFARLRKCAASIDPGRPISTWIVAVVHNLAIDWIRHRDGRLRVSALAQALPPPRDRIFDLIFVQQRSHVETYELLRSALSEPLTFGEFRRELRATYQAAAAAQGGRLISLLAVPPPPEQAESPDDPAVLAEQHSMLTAALETLSPEDRLAVQLYIVDGMPADQVARALGYPGAKTVYNRVYRALAAVRSRLTQAGFGREDL